jgi:predicted kinase
VLVALMGLPGAGKTAVAHYLSERLPLTVLSTDSIRLRHGLASGPDTHELIYEVAAVLLRAGGGIVWDSIHATRRHRSRVRAFAAELGAHLELLYVTADEATIRARLERRAADPAGTAADGKFVIPPERLAQFVDWLEPPDPDEPFTLVDSTDEPPGARLQPLEARLRTLLTRI